MASVGNILLEKEILLESGTNEVEILVFRVGGYSLGINVAKVREVLPAQKITHLPQAHDSIVGCFTLRDQVVPCVSLHEHLGEEAANKVDETTIILTEFNQYQTAFVVDAVERIHRISWEQVLAAPAIVNNSETPVTAVTSIEGRLILMLDFEMIADQVSEKAHRTGVVGNPQNLPRQELRILLAEDSVTVREAVAETLRDSGYTNLTTFENGELAWNWIQERFLETDDVSQVADLLISDVEMPRIDGLHLTKNIKQHPELRKMCVLLYSSIVTPDNRKKGEAVKADGMITKPELSKIVGLADELIVKRESGSQETVPAETPTETVVVADVPEEDATKQSPQSEMNSPEVASETPVVPSQPESSTANKRLWITFRTELSDRVDQLDKQCRLSADEVPNDEVIDDIFRILHSIKSASMVVPVAEVTRITHIVEDFLDAVRQDKAHWSHAELVNYVDWLREVANPLYDEHEVEAVLAEGAHLEKGIVAGTSV